MSQPDTTEEGRPVSPSPAQPASSPEMAADKEPGAGCMIAAAIVGVVLGGALGFFVAWGVAGFFISVLATVGGAMVGGAAGGFLGDRFRQRSHKGTGGPSADG